VAEHLDDMSSNIDQTSTDRHRISPPTATQTHTRRTTRLKPGMLPPWKVVLHNDQFNGMEEVVVIIKMLTPLSEQAAVRRMLEAHARGRSMILTTHRERAELYRSQFNRRGLTVTIAPV
jgi:ATP-dependent Clp protease adaptor protein ClpS